ncbi:Uncharacterized protein TCAP_03688 [Tolypocladium capitatum]|uniref:F-box domain-containing protein n=1 Tax=Tolypocladium capitatum TaxID=45235 RepID=A0A2K3QFP8_9HYPO|nr:Uncharacterized protein TCAP_03688 [Tolypocladium capitatum]
MEDLIDKGSGCYAANKYGDALMEFTRAMNLCPCAGGMKRKRCSCKDFEGVALANGSIFNEAMYNCRCRASQDFNKCDNPLHMKALDYRAATFEAMGELVRAKKDAGWMLELAPCLPDGYLRLGKILRLQKNTELAWKMYSAGIDNTKHWATSSSRKLQKLHDEWQLLKRRFGPKDPLSCFPSEIIYMIFENFDIIELTVWRWSLEAEGNMGLWRSLIFPNQTHAKPPSSFALHKLLARARGDVRQIVIRDPARWKLNQEKMTILLQDSRNLERLELGSAGRYYWSLPRGRGQFRKLRYVSMDTDNYLKPPSWSMSGLGVGDAAAGPVPADFFKSIAGTLEQLELVGVAGNWLRQEDVVDFPELKVLRIEQKRKEPSFPIFPLASKTRGLEQLCLRMHLEWEGVHEWKNVWDKLWNQLKVLVIFMPEKGSDLQVAKTISAVTLLTSLNFIDLQHIDMEIPWTNSENASEHKIFTDHAALSRYGLSHGGEPILRHDKYQDLRTIRLKEFCHVPTNMGRIFRETLHNGKLHTFDIVFPLKGLFYQGLDGHARYLDEHDWLRGCESIRCLGLWRFRFRPNPRGEEDLPLPNFLASFPNLETLSLSSEAYTAEELCSVIEGIMKATNIKTIYQNGVTGVPLDRLREMAEGFGVQVIWGERPREWPVPVEN